jgi:Fe2+ transport system protein B
MSQNDFNQWSADKAKELFSISHKLMDAAKQLSEHHADELKANMEFAMNLAKATAKNDFEKLKDMQTQATQEATERMTAYQAKVKGILKQVNKETADEAEKHLEKARQALNGYMDQVAQKIPVGGAELSKLVKDISEAGSKVYKEGRKIVDQALEQADEQADELLKKATTAKKTTTTAKTTARKTRA